MSIYDDAVEVVGQMTVEDKESFLRGEWTDEGLGNLADCNLDLDEFREAIKDAIAVS